MKYVKVESGILIGQQNLLELTKGMLKIKRKSEISRQSVDIQTNE